MKLEIYKKFTLENKILLNKESLDYLTHSNSDLDKIILFCKQNKIILLTTNIITGLESQTNTNIFQIKKYERKYKNEGKKIEKFKCKGIFGIFYKNYLNELVLENTEIVSLNINLVADVFLFEGMYFGVEGEFKEGKFNVSKINLPEFQLNPTLNEYLVNKNTKIVFIFEYTNTETEILYLNEIIKNENPDFFIFLGSKNPTIIENSKKISINEDLPIEIDFYFGKLAVINSEIFKYKNMGTFLSNNYLNSFINTYLSQKSYNPFSSFNFDYEIVPNLIVIGQEAASNISLCNGVCIASLGSFSRSFTYLVCDTNEWKVEFKTCLD